MIHRKLLWRIFFSSLTITLLALVGVTWYSGNVARIFYKQDTYTNLKDQALLLSIPVENFLKKNDANAIKGWFHSIRGASASRTTVILSSGKVIMDTKENPNIMDNHKDRPEIKEAFEGKVGYSIRFSATLNENLMYVAVPLKDGADIIGVLRVSLPIETIDETLNLVKEKTVVAGVIILIITGVIGWLISRKIAAPLESITKMVDRFAQGDLKTRLSESSAKEVGKLATALHDMAGQLDEKIKTIDRQKNEKQAVFQSMVEGVLAVDNDERLITVNKAALKMLHIDTKEAIQLPIKDVVMNKELRQMISTTLQNKSQELIEDEITLEFDDIRYVQVHGTVLRDHKERIIGVLIVLNDVTRLRRLEQVRRDFVANVSHEIRTPLTSIKGFVETLNDGALSDRQTAMRFLTIIDKQTNRLNSIIDDLLSLVTLEESEERSDIQFTDNDFSGVIKSALDVCKPYALKKNISFEVQCYDHISAKMNATLIEQVLVNFVGNSIKYSPENTKIIVSCEINNQCIVLKVQDEGIGISKDHIKRVFERFYRVDKARSRKEGGTGLGLSIVKHIAKVHNGKVWVESEQGKGSCFYLSLPLEQPTHE
jgi:two-component system phosphate regulon sensor histidine kinase PhoR